MRTWACLGDSLTEGVPSSPTTVLSPWPNRLDALLFGTGLCVANFGMTGTRLNHDLLLSGLSDGPGMYSRYMAGIHNQGFYGLVLWGGVNDILSDEDGASALADYTLIVNQALADGLKVICMITSPAAGYTGGWSPSRQVAIEALRGGILALAGSNPNLIGVVDLYALLGDPQAPTFLAPRWAGVANDGLHHGEDAHTYVIIPALLQLLKSGPAAFIRGTGTNIGTLANTVKATLAGLATQAATANGGVIDLPAITAALRKIVGISSVAVDPGGASSQLSSALITQLSQNLTFEGV